MIRLLMCCALWWGLWSLVEKAGQSHSIGLLLLAIAGAYIMCIFIFPVFRYPLKPPDDNDFY